MDFIYQLGTRSDEEDEEIVVKFRNGPEDSAPLPDAGDSPVEPFFPGAVLGGRRGRTRRLPQNPA